MKTSRKEMARGIGERILARLEELKVPQLWLSERAAIPQSTVAHIIPGHRLPGALVIVKIAEALELDCHFLLTGNAVQHPPDSTPTAPRTSLSARLHRRYRRWHRKRKNEIHAIRRGENPREVEWRQSEVDYIAGRWQQLAGDGTKRQKVESLLSFLSRYMKRKGHIGYFLFMPPTYELRQMARVIERPTAEQVVAMLKCLTVSDLALLHAYIDDVFSPQEVKPTDQVKIKLGGNTVTISAEQAARDLSRLLNQVDLWKHPSGDAGLPPAAGRSATGKRKE